MEYLIDCPVAEVSVADLLIDLLVLDLPSLFPYHHHILCPSHYYSEPLSLFIDFLQGFWLGYA